MRTKEEIYKEFDNLQRELKILNKKQIENSEITKLKSKYTYNDIKLFLNLCRLHQEDYESYVFVSNYILALLKKRKIKLYSEIEKNKEQIEICKNKIFSMEEKNISDSPKKQVFNTNYIKKLKNNLNNLENYIKDCKQKIFEIETSINDYKIFAKEDKILEEQYIPIFESWCNYQDAKKQFEHFSYTEDDFYVLEKDTEIDELKMKLQINEIE